MVVAGVAVLSLAMLAGCQRRTSDVQVVASFHNLSEPFFVAMRRNALDEARKLGIDLMIVDAQSNSAKQTTDVETAVATGTMGVIIAPNDVNALAPAIDYVIDEGVPIATVDRKVDNASRPVPHFGADNVSGGRTMAQFVVDRFPQGARIVLLTGSPGSSSAIDRSTGIHQVLTAAGPNYAIISEQSANWQRDQGLTVTQNILTSLGSTRPDAIIAEDDDMALGAVEALRLAGVKGTLVIGFNATPEALRMVRSGEMAATVEQSPSQQIRAAMDQLVAFIRRGEPVRGASIKPILITRGNLADAERLGEVK
jgi:inositol transport system substrate-binding protein